MRAARSSPCPATLTKSSCPATLTKSPCPATLTKSPCPATLTKSPCPATLTKSPCPATLTKSPWEAATGAAIAFASIQRPSAERSVFLPGRGFRVRVTHVERLGSSRAEKSSCMFTVELSHGEFAWTIRRRYKHFQALHQELQRYRTLLHIPIPTRCGPRRGGRDGDDRKIPALPHRIVDGKRHDDLDGGGRDEHTTSIRRKQIEQYLSTLLETPIYRDYAAMWEFLEVSFLSFIRDLGPKGIEGYLMKRSGGYKMGHCGGGEACSRWSKRWFVLKDSFLLYTDADGGHVSGVLLFDRDFDAQTNNSNDSSHADKTARVNIENMSRTLTVRCPSFRHSLWWSKSLREFAETHGSDYKHSNRFDGFAPPRPLTHARWFVNAAEYFVQVADALQEAKEEIFITDWWLSPEIFLKRPPMEGNYWRLDWVLKRKAESGVRVYVLLYKEVELALGINSGYSKRSLMGMHPNIRVLRHPDKVPSSVLLWAHHEKLVVVDQAVAFLGGLDLAYGRWDDHQHRLTDIGSVQRTVDTSLTHTSERAPMSPISTDSLTDLSVKRGGGGGGAIADGAAARGGTRGGAGTTAAGGVEGSEEPDGAGASGNRDLMDNIVQRWRGVLRNRLTRESRSTWKKPDDKERTATLQGQARFWHGKDYCNFVLKDWVRLDKPFDDFINRHETPRMPWHDVAAVVHGAAARDVARHFIQRWNYTRTMKKKKSTATFPMLVPKSLSTADEAARRVPGSQPLTVQILRSACDWSVGIRRVEDSILQAYVSAIQRSRHYIYIENQFFISCCDDKTVLNGIGDALVQAILSAHREGRRFRVFVVLPLLPGFEGDISSGGASAIHTIMHFNYRTMCRGRYSIVERLTAEVGSAWVNHVSFCGLRTHAELGGHPVTELVYVHSKLMVVDDTTVIIGSANINDRSMLGRRDSEVALVAEDTNFVASTMDGKPYQAGAFAHSLRTYCFRLVLGLLDSPEVDISDPVCDHFFKEVWMATAGRNATVYEKVFRCLPSDFVLNRRQLAAFVEEPAMARADPAGALARLADVRGFLVHFPLYFLRDENLLPALGTKEGLMPSELWT
uniref:Phospholipase n=1 Tax=Petromyzon marinus TaxID=7757 RepID=A0AAJ7XH03_PETMA|nr:phospholipase D1-like [Petromyzon marinus]